MLKEAELDRFLDEFFDGATPIQSEEKNTDESTEDLEEYTLPTDGLIIRQMKRDGKVSRRTWIALALMVIIVPLILYLSVRIFHGRRYMVCSLIVVVAAMLPFFMMFEGRKPKAREIMVISVLAAIGVAGRAAFFMLPPPALQRRWATGKSLPTHWIRKTVPVSGQRDGLVPVLPVENTGQGRAGPKSPRLRNR